MAQDYTVNVKVKGVDTAKTQVDGLTDSMESVGAAGGAVEGQLDKLTGGAVSGFKRAAQGTKAFITGLKLTRAAIIATGIGALVVGVTALVSAFTSTRRGARQLEVVMAGLGAVVEQLTARAQILGGFIVDLFGKGPKAAAENYRKEMDKLPDSIGEAVQALTELQRAEQALRDTRRELTVADAEGRQEIARLRLVARDRNRDTEERIDAAKRAMAIELDLVKQREDAAAEELRIAQERAKMSDTSDEDLQRLADLEANLITIRTQSFMTQRRLQEEVQSVEREATAERKTQEAARTKSREAEAKAAKDAAAAIIKAEQSVVDELDKRSRASLDARTKELLALEDFYNAQLDKAGENAELVAEIEAQREQELADMRQRFRMEDAEKAEQARQQQSEADKEQRESELAQEQVYQDNLASLKQTAIAGTFSILGNLSKAFEKDTEEGQKKAFKRNKAISIAETLVSTYQAAQKAYASQLAIPSPDAPIRAQVAAGVAVAAGLAKVAAIKSQQFSGGGGGGAAAGGGAVGGGGVQSVGVDVGSLVPTAGQETPEPVRAYVVSNEISNKQALDRELQIQTTL